MAFPRPRTLIGLALVAAVFGLTLSAQGQPVVKPLPAGTGTGGPGEKDDRSWNEPITLPVEREAKNKIDAVNKYLQGDKEKNPITAKLWEDIISVLQGLLDDPADKFVEIDTKGNKVSVKREVNRIIGTFDDDGREFYQRIVGPTADQKFKQAQDENDMLLMAEVSTRFLHTKAGAAATVRIGTWHLDRGRYAQAAHTFRLFMLRNPKDTLPPELLYRAALAYKRQAATDPTFAKEAQKYWDLFEKATNRGQLVIGSKTLNYDQLKNEFDKAITAGPQVFHGEWGLFRRDPSNNGTGTGGTPFLEPRFRYDYMMPVDDFNFDQKKAGFEVIRDRIDKALKQLDTKGMAPIPGVYPLASTGKLLFRGYDGVYCIATQEDKSIDPPIKPGELLWKTETDNGLLQMVRDLGPRTMFDQFLTHYTGQGPHAILIENPLLGALSHDGQTCYFIDDLAVPPHPVQWQSAQFGGIQPGFGVFNEAANFSRLKAVDMETGKLKWKVGDRTQTSPVGVAPGFPGRGPVAIDPATGRPVTPAAEEPVKPAVKETTETLLADCFFLGPPLPLAGKLYVIIEKDGDLRLVCLDPNKLEPSSRQPTPVPSLVWSQVLGQPTGRLPMDSFRRYQGTHLAYADGILVVPTNAGAVLGIDLFSHSLIWAANYKSNKTARQQMTGMEGGGRFRPGVMPGNNAMAYELSRERWHAAAPIIAGTRVVFTAFDSDTVECVDLQDGRPVWKTPITRQEGDQYVAGVFDDKVMIVGKGYVRFHSLASGAQIRDPLPTGVPTGLGVATKDLYFVPIQASKDKSNEPGIVAIDTKTMQVKGTSRSRKREVAGNLLFYEGDVYSVSPTAVASYPQLAVRIEETEKRLKANDQDPVGLLDLAMLQHDDGRLEPAIENYRRSLANKPPEDARAKAREKLFEAITELLQNDFNAGEKMLAEYETLCRVEIPASATEAQRQMLAEEELRRRSNYYCLVAKGKEAQGKLLDAFENYMKFGTLVGNKEMVSVIDEPNTNARPDVWARGRIQSMIKKATPEQRKPLEDKVVAEWAKVRQSDDLETLRGFVKVFGGMFEAGTDAKITLADKLSASGNEDDGREAEYMLLAIRDAGEDAAAAAKATEALARLYIRKGLLDDAVGMYAELGRRHAKVIVRDGKTGAEYFNDLITDKRFLPYLEPPVLTWTFPKLKASESLAGGGLTARANTMDVDLPPDVLPFFKRHRVILDMNNRGGQGWSLRVMDRVTSEDRWTTPGVGYPQWIHMFQQQNIPFRMVQVKGHLAVVTNHGNHPQTGMPVAKVFAFDLADRKKLWEVDLFGNTPAPILQAGPVNQAMEADGLRLTYQDGWSTKVGQQWVVEHTYTVVLSKDGLIARDNARGTVLWTKTNVSPRTHMLGDGEYVFLYDANPDGGVGPVRCYRAADGVEVTVPDSSAAFTNVKRAKFYGRKVLTFDDEPGKKAVRLYDLLTGKDLWKKDLPGDGWQLRSHDDSFAGYVTATGDVVVLDAADGREVFKGKLDEAKKAQHLEKVNDPMLFADGERFFVMLNRPNEGQNRISNNPVFTQAIKSVKVNGTMYAFDRANGKRLWYTHEQLEDKSLALEQFAELPIIMAASQYQKVNANGAFEGQFMQFVALDKATGMLKFRKQGLAQGQYYSIVTDPKAGVIEVLNYSGHRVRFVPDDGKSVGSADGPASPGTVTTAPPPAQRIIIGGVGPAVAVPLPARVVPVPDPK